MTKNYGEKSSLSYFEVRELAYRSLEAMEVKDFPVNVASIAKSIKNLRIMTYSECMKRYDMSFRDVVTFADSNDGCTSYDPSDDRFVILYNDKFYKHDRVRFTISHEIAHVILKHYQKVPGKKLARASLTKIDDPTIEREADMFAAEFLAPSFLVRFLPDEDIKYLQSIFDISETSARISLNRVNRLCRKCGPQVLPIPDYLMDTFGVYCNAIQKKQYVEAHHNRINPTPGFRFDPKTGRYFSAKIV